MDIEAMWNRTSAFNATILFSARFYFSFFVELIAQNHVLSVTKFDEMTKSGFLKDMAIL